MRGVADERRRSGAVNAITFDRFVCGLADGGMGGQAEIVLRAEIYTLCLAAQVVGNGASRARARVGRPGIGPEPFLGALVLPVVEALDAPKQIGSLDDAVLTQTAGQCRRQRGFAIALHCS